MACLIAAIVMTLSVLEGNSYIAAFSSAIFRICGTSRGPSSSVELLVDGVIVRIVCKTGPMGSMREGVLVATIGEAVILWETPFKYQVDFRCYGKSVLLLSK